MKKVYLVLVLITMVMLVACGSKDSKNLNKTDEIKNKPIHLENPEELKIAVTDEAKEIQKQVKISNITLNFNKDTTVIKGIVTNNTEKMITPYMNVYIYNKNKTLLVTLNTFVDKLESKSSRQFSTNVLGNYTGGTVEVEIADLE